MEVLMQGEVIVKFSEAEQFRIGSNNPVQISDEEARAWLNQAYEDFDCEPLNPVGKVLAVDKVLSVAHAAGPALFADAQWAGTYAQAALASLKRPVIHVDVQSMSIGY
jgi:hypothetical protein